ncbi:MAG TPA: DinB family protein [Puia sp.]|nr:DinB family protein [Puia sp.]
MKQLLQQYAAYNLWANSKIVEAIDLLSPEQQHKEIVSSFNSLYKTVFHVWGAEFLWWKRVHKQPPVSRLDDGFNNSMSELGKAWIEMDNQWVDFVNNIADEALYDIVDYRRLNGEAYSDPIYMIFHHVFNHSTYHRGQLITMLRQAGAEKIPNGDFIAWARVGK